jgi:hypothetical protein
MLVFLVGEKRETMPGRSNIKVERKFKRKFIWFLIATIKLGNKGMGGINWDSPLSWYKNFTAVKLIKILQNYK